MEKMDRIIKRILRRPIYDKISLGSRDIASIDTKTGKHITENNHHKEVDIIIRLFGIVIIRYHLGRGIFWIRTLGILLSIKDVHIIPLTFSERNGYHPYLIIRDRWLIRFLVIYKS